MAEVVAHPLPDCPLAACQLTVGVGWRHDPATKRGLAHLMEHALFLGTRHHPDVDAVAAPYGVTLDGRTDPEATSYNMLCLAADAERIVDLLVDVVLWPAFDSDKLRTEQAVVASSTGGESDFAPWSWSLAKLEDMLFGFDTAGSLGTIESVQGITRDDLIDWHRRHYQPSNVTASVAGDAEVVRRVVARLSDSLPGEATTSPRSGDPAGQRTYHRHDPGMSPELHLGFRFGEGVDQAAAELVRVLLGNTPRSRLWQRLRTDSSVAYTVDTTLRHVGRARGLAVYAGLAEGVSMDRAWHDVVGVIRDVLDRPPSRDELAWAKRVAHIDLARRRLDPTRTIDTMQARWPHIRELPGATDDPLGALSAAIEATGPDQVAAAAQAVFGGGGGVVSVVGDIGGWDLDGAPSRLDGL